MTEEAQAAFTAWLFQREADGLAAEQPRIKESFEAGFRAGAHDLERLVEDNRKLTEQLRMWERAARGIQ